MLKRFSFLLLGCLFASSSMAGNVKLNSKSYILVDYSTMQVLEALNENERMSPASLTKVMTAYIAYDYISKGKISLSDEVLISSNAWKTGGSRMFIEVGKKVTFDELLKGLIIQSGNDAAVAIAEHISGTVEAFSEVMNYYADTLGMKGSNFDNSSGLPSDNHYTTAKDLSLIAYRTIKDYPELMNYYSVKEFEFNNIFQKSSNKMLSYDYFDGMKAGFTEGSGYSYIGTASKDNKRLIIVQLGAETSKARFRDAEILSNHYFDDFKKYKVADKYEIIKEANTAVIAGDVNFVRGAASEDVVFLLPNNTNPKINIELKIAEKLKSPVVVGQKIGDLVVYIDDLEAKRVDVVSVEAVGRGSPHKIFFESINSFLRGES